jgi:PelA/Pel-15E family pectate lyase
LRDFEEVPVLRRLLFAAMLAFPLAPVFADAVTQERIAALPGADRAAWEGYMGRSKAAAEADRAALRAEVEASGAAAALRAPDGGDFKLPAKAGDAWYAGEEARQLADVILSYQTPSGGWSKHTGYSKGPRKAGMQWTSQNAPGEPDHYVATFDNRSTTEQLHFLANVWQATGREDCKAAFERGLNFVLAAQYPNGGWPQVYPVEGGYHDDITFNDDAMTHVLQLLEGIRSKEPCYAFLDDAQRAKAAGALKAGIDCVLKARVEVNGKKTVWCAQFDALTLRPSRARAMEPATLSGLESAGILEFLMSIREPSPEIVQAIETGLAWFEQAKIKGIARVKEEGKTVYKADAASTEVYWARFYDLQTGKPVFPGRDGVLYDTFEGMAAKNAVGYDYYTTQPNSLLNTGQKQWRKRLAQANKD